MCNCTFRGVMVTVFVMIFFGMIAPVNMQAQTGPMSQVGNTTKAVVNNTTTEKPCDLPIVGLFMIPIGFLLLMVVVGLIDRRQYYIDKANGYVDSGFF